MTDDEVAHPRLQRLLNQQTRRSPMTVTMPPLSTLPSAQWERVRDGITDLDPDHDKILVWVNGEWLPARIDHTTTKSVVVELYDWIELGKGNVAVYNTASIENHRVHISDVWASERPEPLREHYEAPIAHVARRLRDRGPRPGRPKIGPKIGPYPVPPHMHDGIIAFERNGDYESQAGAVRDLLQSGLRRARRGAWPMSKELRERIKSFQVKETFDTFDEAAVFLLEDALNAANY